MTEYLPDPMLRLDYPSVRRWRDEVRRRRLADGLSVRDLADASGVSTSTVRAIEDTERKPDYYPTHWTVLWIIDGLDWDLRDAAATLRGPDGTLTAKHADLLDSLALDLERLGIPESVGIIQLYALYAAAQQTE